MSLSSFHLKGSGWYATDYSGEKAPAGEKKKEDKAPETEKSQPPSKTKSEE
jgi:predicted nucleic acid-binding Zn ribbon protein